MLITGVIDHQIHHVLHPPLMQTPDQIVMVLHRPIRGVDVAVVGNVVAHVDLRGCEDWAEPDAVDAEGVDVVQARDYAGNVAVAD